MPGLSSPEKEELAAARRRIAQLETELAVTRRAAELLKEQAPPFDRVVRVIRDIFSPDFVELVVDGDDLYQRVEEYLTEVAPDLLPKLHRHQGKLPVFEHYRVVEQIHKALERKVWLPSACSTASPRPARPATAAASSSPTRSRRARRERGAPAYPIGQTSG